MLIVALDANFKLKNRIRTNATYDPPLGAGCEYFVEPKEYKKHLKNYVPEKDVGFSVFDWQAHWLTARHDTDQLLHCFRSITSKRYAFDGGLASEWGRRVCVRAP